ncbi:LytTR family DNA-binding domain-containing protein [Peptococcaceae bacterium 1198_IL3148]
MTKILLLEDEDYTRRFLKKIILESTLVDEVLDTPGGSEAITLAREYKPQIVLLDIELAPEEEINGIDVGRIIYNDNPNTYFVFITGYSKYAVDSFSVHPYDYILKPIKKARVLEVINSLASKVAKDANFPKNERILIKSKNEIIFVSLQDILFVEKLDKKSFIHTCNNVIEANDTLTELENTLRDGYLRVHKSYIVNLAKVKKIKDIGNRSYVIQFDGTDKVAYMSRYKFEEYKDKFFTPL